MRRSPGAIAFAVATIAIPAVCYSQGTCSLDQGDLTNRIHDRALALTAGMVSTADVARVTESIIEMTPSATPDAPQLSSTTASGTDSSLVDSAVLNKLLGLAIENGLATSSGNAVTIDLNLFALKAALDRSVIEKQSEYAKYTFMRRFSGSLTLGGDGEPVDSDGDGVLEPAKPPESLSDIVTLDLQFRLSKLSRDRRDKENYELIQNRVRDGVVDVDAATNAVLTKFLQQGVFTGSDCGAKFDAALQMLDANALRVLGVGLNAVNVSFEDAVRDIDARMLWTLAISGTERDREFGSDKLRVGVRGSMGGNNKDMTFNFDYGETENLTALRDPKTAKLAFEWKTTVLENLVGGGVETSFSANLEHFEDVPDVLHDRVAKLNVRFVYPLTDTIKIPISVTWANHADLLSDESDLRGNIGFTVDFDPLVKPKP